MKILLVGEYSGLHNNLKDGLIRLGHEVVIASTGDGFKNLATDISFRSGKRNALLRFIDMTLKYITALPKMKGFDVVQFINPYIFSLRYDINGKMIKFLMRNNKKAFLSVAGDDTIIWDYWRDPKTLPMKYLWINGQKKEFEADGIKDIVWDNIDIRKLNHYMADHVNAIIPIMYEYYQPYKDRINTTSPIAIPINIDKISYQENRVKDKIVIFHGLNRYHAKGTKYVEEAFAILKEKYPNDLELIIKGKMPYKEYEKLVRRSNVIIDQVYSYSLAMNALISMAQGKIVLGGNEAVANSVLSYKGDNPAIEIIPDAQQIVQKIEFILENRRLIPQWGQKSRDFVEMNHHYVDIAHKYLKAWSTF